MDIIREFLFDVINKDDRKFLIIYLYKNKMISNLSEFKIKKKKKSFYYFYTNFIFNEKNTFL